MVETTVRDDRPPTVLESALRYDRAPAVILVIVVPLVSWIWIVVMARDMYGPMTGASAWMMTPVWDARHLALLWAMWAVMMAGMMLPSASPMLLLYGSAARRSATGASAPRQIYALAAGYLAAWAAFSLGATVLQRLLSTLLVLSSMMEVTSSVVGATLLLSPLWSLAAIPFGRSSCRSYDVERPSTSHSDMACATPAEWVTHTASAALTPASPPSLPRRRSASPWRCEARPPSGAGLDRRA